jgi:hypothetical protein
MTFAAEPNRIYDFAFCYLSVVSLQNLKICSVYAGRSIRVNDTYEIRLGEACYPTS